MAFRLALGAILAAVLLVGPSTTTAGERQASTGLGVVFSVFENLPPDGACPGLYAVDAATRDISWLGAWRAQSDDFAAYPQFTARGTLSYAHFADPSASGAPSADLYAGDRVVARASWPTWAWSPRREEVAFVRVAGRRLQLVLASVTGATRVLAPSAGLWISWLPDGSGLVYTRRLGTRDVITFVRRDGGGRRNLVTNPATNAPAPLVSPDGRRVAFVRTTSSPSGRGMLELWVVGLRGGQPRKVLGTRLAEGLRPMLWLSNRELLVQRGGEPDPFFDARDTVNRVDVDTRKERVFLRRGFALSLSPDGKHVLFVRSHGNGEGYFSIRTVRTDGRGGRLLAVTDEEDLNIGSLPVWKPAGVQLGPVGDRPIPNAPSEAACVGRLTALRARTP